MPSSRLTFVALSVSDLTESVDFYRMLLGVPLRDEAHDQELNDPWYGGPHAAISWTNGAFLHFAIYPSNDPTRPQHCEHHRGVAQPACSRKRVRSAQVQTQIEYSGVVAPPFCRYQSLRPLR